MSAARSARPSAPLYSYFALVADDPSVQIVSQRADLVHQGDAEGHRSGRTCRSSRPRRRSRPAARSGPDYYTDVPAGAVAIKNVADLYLYPNTIRAVEITGAQVKEWLEMSAGIFNQIEPGARPTAADRPRLPDATISTSSTASPTRSTVSQPPRYDQKGERHRMPTPTASSTCSSTASRSTRRRSSSSPPTTTAPAAAAIFPGINGKTIIFAAPDTNRDVIVRYIVETGHDQPVGRRQLVVRAAARHDRRVPVRPQGQGFRRRREGVKIEPAGEGEAGFAKYRILL